VTVQGTDASLAPVSKDRTTFLSLMQEASSQMWSTRELERNILSQYYYRLR